MTCQRDDTHDLDRASRREPMREATDAPSGVCATDEPYALAHNGYQRPSGPGSPVGAG